mgnify:CR=1 FL=1
MRALLISFLTLVLLVGCWFSFYQYSVQNLHQMIIVCEEEGMPAIDAHHWKQAYKKFNGQYQAWHRYKKRALFMMETDKIKETDAAFAKTLMYIKAKDLSNSSGELLALQESLKYLHNHERITLSNIL